MSRREEKSFPTKTALLVGFLFLISGITGAQANEKLPPACRNRYDLKTGDPTTADVIAIYPSVNTLVHCVIELLEKSTNRKRVARFNSEDLHEVEELCSIMKRGGYECSTIQNINGYYSAYFWTTKKTETGGMLITSQLGPNIFALSETPRYTPGVEVSTSTLERKKEKQSSTITIRNANETMKSVM